MFLTKIAIFFLWIGAVIDPVGKMFGIRYIALAIAFFCIAGLFFGGRVKWFEKSYRGALIFLMTVFMPIYGLTLYSFQAGSSEFIDISYLASGLLMITSLLYFSPSICQFGIKSFVISMRLLSFLVIMAFITPAFQFAEWISFFTERNVALISVREYGDLTFPYTLFLASPVLILLMAYDLQKVKQKPSFLNLIIFTITSFALFLTGTRAHILLAVLYVPIYSFLTSTRKNILRALIYFFGVIVLGLMIKEVRDLVSIFFSTSATNNSMKLALFDGYTTIFSNPLILLFGQGFNAHEWSSTLRGMIAMDEGASKTELTYIEIVRVFGLVIGTIFMSTIFLLVRSTKNLGQNYQWVFPGLTIYLINAAINPYLFSINGVLPLGLISALVYHHGQLNKKYLAKNVNIIKVGVSTSL